MLDKFIHRIVRSTGVRLGIVAALASGGLVIMTTEFKSIAYYVGSFLVLGGAIVATIINVEIVLLYLEQQWKKRGRHSLPALMGRLRIGGPRQSRWRGQASARVRRLFRRGRGRSPGSVPARPDREGRRSG